MKQKFMKIVQLFLLSIALFGANTPSQAGMFQLKCPEKLKEKKIF